MQQVPAEILIAVVSKLNQHNKLKCILVCKAWYTAICSSVLFESLRLDSQQKRDLALTYFRSEPELALQVKRLYIPRLTPQDFKDSLPSLFPNLTEIDADRGQEDDFLSEVEEIKKWNKLERVNIHPPSFSRAVLLSASKNLRYLSVGFVESEIQEDFVNSLKNAPNLEELHVKSSSKIMLDYMEKLYAAVPRLKVLYMYLYFFTGQGEIDFTTVQVATLKRFELLIGEISGPFDQWFEYFGRKYQQLEEIKITHMDDWYEPVYQPLLIKMLQQMPLLTTIDIHIAPLSEDMLTSNNLTKIGITDDGDMEDLEVVISATKKNITSFNVSNAQHGRINEDIWRDKFLRASSVYNLTELTVSRIECNPGTFIHILDCFPNLKTVDFDTIKCYNQDCQITKSKTTSAIQNLSLSIMTYCGEATTDTINLTLQYILDACPLLEIFKYGQSLGRPAPRGGIILDLQKHKKLKSFTASAIYKQYFKFSHIPEKKNKLWKTFYTELPEDEVECENYLDLAWHGYVDLHLKSAY